MIEPLRRVSSSAILLAWFPLFEKYQILRQTVMNIALINDSCALAMIMISIDSIDPSKMTLYQHAMRPKWLRITVQNNNGFIVAMAPTWY